MDARDNERHFKAWLDKNSWRNTKKEADYSPGDYKKDLEDLARRYGVGPKHTDEFSVPVMDVIHHLLEAFLFVPRGECSRCGAEIRVSRNDRGPHLCTVDSMLEAL